MCLNYDIIIAQEDGDCLGKVYTVKSNQASKIATILKHDLGIELNDEQLRKTTLTTCTCLIPNSYGLPCRHMLWIYRQKQLNAFLLV